MESVRGNLRGRGVGAPLRRVTLALALGLAAACPTVATRDRIAVAAPASSVAPAHPIWTWVESVSAKLTALGTGFRASPAEWQQLAIGARQLIDPDTGAPYVTSRGNALLYWLFEPASPRAAGADDAVLFLSGVHTDELSPLCASFHALFALQKDPSLRPPSRLVYVALVNPDGLRATLGARRNGNDVDLNANLQTRPMETENRFVVQLLDLYKPAHVVSLHGPFGWVDYDGPGMAADAAPADREHMTEWSARVAAAGRVPLPVRNDFPDSPGSLGAFAGAQRRLHVMTIELPHFLAGECDGDWAKYGGAVLESVRVRSPASAAPSAIASAAPSASTTPLASASASASAADAARAGLRAVLAAARD